jgi:hypothetical protein
MVAARKGSGGPVSPRELLLAVSLAASVAVACLIDYPQIPEPDLEAEVLWLGSSWVARAPTDVWPWSVGQNLGVDGYRIRHLREQLPKLIGTHASVIVLSAGRGELLDGWRPEEAIAPDAEVVLFGALPAPVLDERQRAELNQRLSRLPVTYVEPPRWVSTHDELHPDADGYRMLADVIGPIVAGGAD